MHKLMVAASLAHAVTWQSQGTFTFRPHCPCGGVSPCRCVTAKRRRTTVRKRPFLSVYRTRWARDGWITIATHESQRILGRS